MHMHLFFRLIVKTSTELGCVIRINYLYVIEPVGCRRNLRGEVFVSQDPTEPVGLIDDI